MKPRKGMCAGQVIIEKEFADEEAAQKWMERIRRDWEENADNVETHLWVTWVTPSSPLSIVRSLDNR